MPVYMYMYMLHACTCKHGNLDRVTAMQVYIHCMSMHIIRYTLQVYIYTCWPLAVGDHRVG